MIWQVLARKQGALQGTVGPDGDLVSGGLSEEHAFWCRTAWLGSGSLQLVVRVPWLQVLCVERVFVSVLQCWNVKSL